MSWDEIVTEIMVSIGEARRHVVMDHWDIPLYQAWRRTTGNMPPIHIMVGVAAGFKLSEENIAEETPAVLTPEQVQAKHDAFLDQLITFGQR